MLSETKRHLSEDSPSAYLTWVDFKGWNAELPSPRIYSYCSIHAREIFKGKISVYKQRYNCLAWWSVVIPTVLVIDLWK